MPLAPNVLVTPHFTAYELGADKPEANDAIVANLRLVAAWLEVARSIVRREIGATSDNDSRGKFAMGRRSGFRTLAENGAVGGSGTSNHLDGRAADFTPIGVPLRQAYKILETAAQFGELPRFDQLIYYAYDGHIHVGLGSRMRGEYRIQVVEGGPYLLATADLINKLPGNVTAAIAAVGSAVQSSFGVSLAAVVNVLLIAVVLIFIGNLAA